MRVCAPPCVRGQLRPGAAWMGAAKGLCTHIVHPTPCAHTSQAVRHGAARGRESHFLFWATCGRTTCSTPASKSRPAITAAMCRGRRKQLRAGCWRAGGRGLWQQQQQQQQQQQHQQQQHQQQQQQRGQSRRCTLSGAWSSACQVCMGLGGAQNAHIRSLCTASHVAKQSS